MSDLTSQELATADEIVIRLLRGVATASAQDGLRAIMRLSRERHGARHDVVKTYALARVYGGKG